MAFFLILMIMNLFLAVNLYGCREEIEPVDMDMGYEGNKQYEMLRKALSAGSKVSAEEVAEEMNGEKK